MIQAAVTGVQLKYFDRVQPKNAMKSATETDEIRAPIIALDLGEKRVGVAVSDGLAISIRPLEPLVRTNWKQMLLDVQNLAQRFDAKTMVIGLPLSLNGAEREAASAARQTARKFAQSLAIPIYLQDERLTSLEARQNLKDQGLSEDQIASRLDSESAVVILRDFLASNQARHLVEATSRDT